MSAAKQVCDGWDVAVMTGGGARIVLHFADEPDGAQVAAALAAYEEMLATEPPDDYEVTGESGEGV